VGIIKPWRQQCNKSHPSRGFKPTLLMKYVILRMHRGCRLGTKGFPPVKRIFPKSPTATDHSSLHQRKEIHKCLSNMSFSFDIDIHATGPHQATEPDRCKNNRSIGTAPAIFPHTPTTKHTRTTHRSTHRLTVAPEREGVVPLPRLAAAGRRLVVAVALAETARLLAGGGEAAGFAVLL
jgi:hypothetical protein